MTVCTAQTVLLASNIIHGGITHLNIWLLALTTSSTKLIAFLLTLSPYFHFGGVFYCVRYTETLRQCNSTFGWIKQWKCLKCFYTMICTIMGKIGYVIRPLYTLNSFFLWYKMTELEILLTHIQYHCMTARLFKI